MTTYEILNLIIMGIGVIATLSAVIVALWQTKFNNRKKIKLKLYEQESAFIPDLDEQTKFTSLKIINIGNRIIKIKNNGLIVGKEKYVTLIAFQKFKSPVEQCLLQDFNNQVTLNIEETFELNWLNKQITLIAEKAQAEKPECLNKYIYFSIVDSTGKLYKIKSKYKLNDYLIKNTHI